MPAKPISSAAPAAIEPVGQKEIVTIATSTKTLITEGLLSHNCYGNNMPFAFRYRHGRELEIAIVDEVAALAARHTRGFVVRLHDLGDFYSEHYAYLWGGLVGRYAALHVFGYTARQDLKADPIARVIKALTDMYWPRFAIRWSDGPGETRNTIAIAKASDRPKDAVICPAQTHRVARCGDCGLWWTSELGIAFLQH